MNFKKPLVGLLGKPVNENPTQVMIEAAFKSLDLDWRYVTFEVEPSQLQTAVYGAQALGLQGFHCTLPHKVSVIAFLNELDESARLTGAVNCVTRTEHGEWRGFNTDGKGLIQALAVDLRDRKVLMFGAGGAARAICAELLMAGAGRVTIVNRGEQRALDMLSELRRRLPGHVNRIQLEPWIGAYNVPPETNLVVNATSIGLFPDAQEFPIVASSLMPYMTVADVIPNPPMTWLLRAAQNRGCRVVDGLEMLVRQGAIGVAHWTGCTPPLDPMRQALAHVFAAGN